MTSLLLTTACGARGPLSPPRTTNTGATCGRCSTDNGRPTVMGRMPSGKRRARRCGRHGLRPPIDRDAMPSRTPVVGWSALYAKTPDALGSQPR